MEPTQSLIKSQGALAKGAAAEPSLMLHNVTQLSQLGQSSETDPNTQTGRFGPDRKTHSESGELEARVKAEVLCSTATQLVLTQTGHRQLARSALKQLRALPRADLTRSILVYPINSIELKRRAALHDCKMALLNRLLGARNVMPTDLQYFTRTPVSIGRLMPPNLS